MLRVALVLRSTDVRPDFLVLHLLFVHIVEYMSLVGNRTPGPYLWWLCRRNELCIAGTHSRSIWYCLHANDIDFSCAWWGHGRLSLCLLCAHGSDCQRVHMDTIQFGCVCFTHTALTTNTCSLTQYHPSLCLSRTHTALTVVVLPWTRSH